LNIDCLRCTNFNAFSYGFEEFASELNPAFSANISNRASVLADGMNGNWMWAEAVADISQEAEATLL